MSAKVQAIITERFIKELENNTIPWQKPFFGLNKCNLVSGHSYTGVNIFLLPDFEKPYFLTFNQAKKENIRIRYEECKKGNLVTFWKQMPLKDKETSKEKIKSFPLMRYYYVYNISQCEESERIDKLIQNREKNKKHIHFEPIADCEKALENYQIEIRHSALGEAFYSPTQDKIHLPNKEQFCSNDFYYKTRFHETVHSTGHKSRLNRFDNADQFIFSSESYSKEELIAEIGSAMLMSICGIESTFENSVSYVKGWLKALKDDKTMIERASSKAYKAVNLILGKENQNVQS